MHVSLPSHPCSNEGFVNYQDVCHWYRSLVGQSVRFATEKSAAPAHAGPLALCGKNEIAHPSARAPTLLCCDMAGEPQRRPLARAGPPARGEKGAPAERTWTCASGTEPPWPNGHGVGLLIRKLRARAPRGGRSCDAIACAWHAVSKESASCAHCARASKGG